MKWQPSVQALADENLLSKKECIGCGTKITDSTKPGQAMEFDRGFLCFLCQERIAEAQEPPETI